jgi:hypothetical protein
MSFEEREGVDDEKVGLGGLGAYRMRSYPSARGEAV